MANCCLSSSAKATLLLYFPFVCSQPQVIRAINNSKQRRKTNQYPPAANPSSGYFCPSLRWHCRCLQKTLADVML
ncbi:hypothetical protein HDK77DRAFT_435752 [Phyllosticta capitalensis]